jgi:cyclohexadieny/prephenate dehydrogenase
MTQVYGKVALIGLGLIASSIFWAVKRSGAAHTLTGYARSAETRATARDIGLCDTVCDCAADAVRDADLVILCVPVGAMSQVAASQTRCDSLGRGLGQTRRD